MAYLVCDKLIKDGYEKTVLSMAAAYSDDGMYELSLDQIHELSEIMNIDSIQFEEALTGKAHREINSLYSDSIEQRQKQKKLFDVFCRLLFIKRGITSIADSNDINDLYSNVELIRDIISLFELANADLDEYNVADIGDWYRYLLFDQHSTTYGSFPNILLASQTDAITEEISESIHLQYRWFIYEISTKANTLFFFACLFLIQDSKYFSVEIKNVAKRIIMALMPMATDSRILNLQINNHLPDKEPEKRRKESNTAGLQIVLGFDNFDAYYIRLDRAHEGQPSIHINCGTPGGLSNGTGKWAQCYFFTSTEYEKIISEHPSFADCMISHETRGQTIYFIKEKANCSISEQEKDALYCIIREKAHEAFGADMAEQDFNDFISCLSLIMHRCTMHISSDYSREKVYFQINHLMVFVFLLMCFSGRLNPEDEKKLLKNFFEHANRYGIEYDFSNYEESSAVDICLALDELLSKTNIDDYFCY